MDRITSEVAWNRLAANIAVSPPRFDRNMPAQSRNNQSKLGGGMLPNSSGHGFDHRASGGRVTESGQKFMCSHLPARFGSMR